jgi:hypothetical protein
MVKSLSCFNLYWAWLLIFLGAHESQVADPMIEAQNQTSITASATFGYSASPDNVTMALQ